MECPAKKEIVITSGSTTTAKGSNRSMAPCIHEEADTRLLVHLHDAIIHGSHDCWVRTVDTDVVVIVIGQFYYLQEFCQNLKIWTAFGSGKHYCYYHINAICEYLGREKSQSLPVFHSFTGCDTTSAFGRGKSQHGKHGKHGTVSMR